MLEIGDVIVTAKRIQETALKYFAEKGYDATTLGDIAGEIGIKKPSIYAHYASKMDLFLAIVEENSIDYSQCWRQALDATAHLPADEHLYKLFSLISQHYITNKIKMAFWVRLWMFPPADCPIDILASLKTLNNQFIMEVSAIFAEGSNRKILRQAEPTELAHAYFCLLDGYLMRSICYPGFDYQKALPEIWQCFEAGIKI